jgi:ketopantoate reductase
MEKEKNYLIVGTGERLARFVPESPSSMQKDLAHGHASEIQGILFDMIALGDRLGVEMPTYRRVAGKFRP